MCFQYEREEERREEREREKTKMKVEIEKVENGYIVRLIWLYDRVKQVEVYRNFEHVVHRIKEWFEVPT